MIAPSDSVGASFAGRGGAMSAMIRAQEEKKIADAVAKAEAHKVSDGIHVQDMLCHVMSHHMT